MTNRFSPGRLAGALVAGLLVAGVPAFGIPAFGIPAFGILGAAPAGAAPAGAARAATCYVPGPNDTCLDTAVTPMTGQRNDLSGEYGGETPNGFGVPAGLRGTQHHGVVRLRENAYIDAHDICRHVDNQTSDGPGLFLGLETRPEWVSVIDHPPAGALLTACCRPVVVEVCGAPTTIPYSKLAATLSVSGGISRVVTYTCANTTAGAVPTWDTSWLSSAAGDCAAANQSDCRAHGGDKGGDCPTETAGDTGDHRGGGYSHDHGAGPGGDNGGVNGGGGV